MDELDFLEMFTDVGTSPSAYQYWHQLLHNRTIVFNVEIDEDIVERIYLPLRDFENDSSQAPVTLILHSPGGSVSDGYFLAEYISQYKKPLNIIVLGFAASMAAFVSPKAGRICLSSSIGWGFAAILLFRVLHPLTDKFIALYSVDTGKKAIYVIGIIYALDFTFATIAAVDISKQLEKAEYVFSEFVRYIKSFNAAEGREEIKEKALVFFSESPGAEFFRRMMKRYDVSVAVWNDRFSKLGLPNREDVKAAAKRFSERMDLKSFKMNYAHRRVFNAYPHIKTQKRLMDMGFEERFNAEQDKEPGDKEP